jgi:hypothetical protein
MATDKSFELSTVLTVAVVGVGAILLLRMLLSRQSVVVQERNTNPLVAAIDAVPGIINAVGGLFRGGNGSGEIDAGYVDSLPVQW